MQRRVIAFGLIIAVFRWDPRFFGDKDSVVSFFIVDDKSPIHMRSEEKVLGAWQPFNF